MSTLEIAKIARTTKRSSKKAQSREATLSLKPRLSIEFFYYLAIFAMGVWISSLINAPFGRAEFLRMDFALAAVMMTILTLSLGVQSVLNRTRQHSTNKVSNAVLRISIAAGLILLSLDIASPNLHQVLGKLPLISVAAIALSALRWRAIKKTAFKSLWLSANALSFLALVAFCVYALMTQQKVVSTLQALI